MADFYPDFILKLPEPDVPVKGVVLVGPLPAEIQNFTTYSAAIGASASDAAAAKALVQHLASPAIVPVLQARGMQKP